MGPLIGDVGPVISGVRPVTGDVGPVTDHGGSLIGGVDKCTWCGIIHD